MKRAPFFTWLTAVIFSLSGIGADDGEKAADLTVEGDSNRSAEVRTLLKPEGSGDETRCKFILKDPRFRNDANPWSGLPILVTNPKKEKPIPEQFQKSLVFPKSERLVSEDAIEFLTTFKRGDFSFSSLWKLSPSYESKKCGVKAELCAKIAYSDNEGKAVCLSEFKWISKLIAIPHLSNYLLGRPTDVQAIRAEYLYVDRTGTIRTEEVDYN